jgi:DNA invertase Pin-like site-specific DNA recombinase
MTTTRAAIYARVSTSDQTCENQLLELRRYCEARGWQATEYVDSGISGAKDKRPALDGLLKDAKRRRLDVLVCWRLDRLGRNLRHLVTMLEDLNHVGVAFVSLGEGIDCTTPAGKLQLHILAALAEFERTRIAERVRAGLARVRSKGQRFGRPERNVPETTLAPVRGLPIREAAKATRCLTGHGASLAVSENPLGIDPPDPLESSTFRGHCRVLRCSINQLISGTASVGRH